jgi:hypothetical protein
MDLKAEIDGIRDFHYLVLPLLRGDLDELESWSVPDFHWQLYGNFDKVIREQLTVAPVGFAKSTILKIWGVYQFLNKIDPYVLYVSSSSSKADKQFESILKIVKDVTIQTIYDYKVIKDTMTEIVIEFKSGKKQKFESIASGKDILGINYEGQRPTLILIDDIEEEEQARSVDRTDKLMNWLLTSLISRLPSLTTGRVRMIGTVLSRDSLTNRILGKSKTFNQQIFRDWGLEFYQALDSKNKSIWEEMHATAALLKEKELKPYIFAANYMNEPLDEIITGAYYENEINEVVKAGRYGEFLHNPLKPVDTYWDLAVSHDLNAIWFVQVEGDKINVIDYWEGTGMSTSQIARVLFGKPYLYGCHFGPHDLVRTQQGETANRTTLDLYRAVGISFKIVGKTSVYSGRQAVKELFPRFHFNANPEVALGFNRLKGYRAREIPNSGGLSEEVHDINSHAADAIRYLAVTVKLNQSEYFAKNENSVANTKNLLSI